VDAGLFEGADLVVHQGDQRLHDDGDALVGAMAHDRRHLVAQALAPPVGISTSESPPPMVCSMIGCCRPRKAS
jgi:hypothetical protein